MANTVRISTRPIAARVVEGDLDSYRDQRVEAREREAYERGLAAGRAELVESGAEALVAALNQIEERTAQNDQLLARHAIELGVEIARSIIRVRIEADEYDLEQVVRGALADSGVGRGEITVHLHPEDFKALEAGSFRSETHLAVDPALPRGDVHLSTPRGLLVRDVEGALSSVREQLLEELA